MGNRNNVGRGKKTHHGYLEVKALIEFAKKEKEGPIVRRRANFWETSRKMDRPRWRRDFGAVWGLTRT